MERSTHDPRWQIASDHRLLRTPPGASRAVALVVVTLLASTGCTKQFARVSSASDAIPANWLNAGLFPEASRAKVPIDFSLLSQSAPLEHVIGQNDTLGLYIQGIIEPSGSDLKALYSSTVGTRDAYPPTGLIPTPVVGVPLRVSDAGTLTLPLLGEFPVQGMTLDQAAVAIRRAYVFERQLIAPGRDRILVTLIKPRVHRVLVIREDVNFNRASYYRAKTPPYTKRGSSAVVDLPTYENDVFHALLATGGLPGIDAMNEVWVLRSRVVPDESTDRKLPPLSRPVTASRVVHTSTHLPLQIYPAEPVPFDSEDVVLEQGDIVYLKSRDDEVFFTGGLLPGGVFPLPRDRDLTVIEAMALVTGSAGGPAGSQGRNLNFRNPSSGGTINPTRVLLIRRMPDGEQVKISVDLSSEAQRSGGRLLIRPNDFLMLQYKPGEYLGNFALMMFRTGIQPSNNGFNSANASSTLNGGGGGNAGSGGGGEATGGGGASTGASLGSGLPGGG